MENPLHNRIANGAVFGCAVVSCLLVAFASPAIASSQLIEIQVPTNSQANGINASGAVVGEAKEGQACGQGTEAYLYAPDGTVTTISPSNAYFASAWGINDQGSIVGIFEPNQQNPCSTEQNPYPLVEGFLRSPSGTTTIFSVGAGFTEPNAINNHGWIVGGYAYNHVESAFVRMPNGTISTFQAPGSQSTDAFSINKQNTSCGVYADASGVAHAFILTSNLSFTSFDAPGAGTSSGQGTFGCQINDSGTAAGTYFDANGLDHGYLRSSDGSFTTVDVPGAQGTGVSAINDTGVITGSANINGVTTAFIQRPDGKLIEFSVDTEIEPSAINAGDEVVGSYLIPKKQKVGSFLRSVTKN